MRIAKKIAFISMLFFTVLLSSFMPSDVSAVQLGIDVEPNWTQYTFQPYWTYTSSGSVGYSTSYELSVPTSAGSNWIYSVNKVRLQVPSGMALNKGGYLVYSFKLDNFETNNSIDGNFISACVSNQGTLNSSLSVLDVEYQSLASTGYQVNVYITNNFTIGNSSSVRYFEISSCSGSNELAYLKASERIIFTEANFYKLKEGTNYSSSINDVKNAINSTNNKLDQLKNSQDRSNSDANDRYQDEKDTTYDEANNGKDDMENGFSMPSLLNPLNSWKSYFVNNGCSVNIPLIAGWLGSRQNTYTSWWCTNNSLRFIRNSLTVVFSIVGVMIVFSFAFKWLRTNQGED